MTLNLANPLRVQRLRQEKQARRELWVVTALLVLAAVFFRIPKAATLPAAPVMPPTQTVATPVHPLPEHAHLWFAAWSLLPPMDAKLKAIEFQQGPQQSVWQLRYETPSLDWFNDYLAALNATGAPFGWHAELRQSRNVQGMFLVLLEVQQ